MHDACHMEYADLLVLGAGLAGMRAAVAALEANPGLRVVVVRKSEGPSGSSFANRNNALGIQVAETERERELFMCRAVEVGAPGHVDPGLVSLLAAEGVTRFNDLRRMGVPFLARKAGGLQRVPGCFLPQAPTCYILNDLAAAYNAFTRRFSSLGGKYISGVTVTDIVSRTGEGHAPAAVLGILARPMQEGPALAIQAKAVVMALGGPSPLFSRDTSGPGNPGFAYALLARAGARLENTGYLQFMWHRTDNGGFFPVHSLAHPDMLVRTPENEIFQVPESLRLLGQARKEYCPFGRGVPGTALDIFLAKCLGAEGSVSLRLPDGQWIAVEPMAHAGNGGAVIDEHGHTGVPGLYACGECATGMHGANRLGGAMVLATQVFGARAGRAAAQEVARRSSMELPPDHTQFMEAALQALARHNGHPCGSHMDWLKKNMQRHVVPGGSPGLREFGRGLAYRLRRETDPLESLPLESALAIVGHLTRLEKEGKAFRQDREKREGWGTWGENAALPGQGTRHKGEMRL